MDEAVIPVRVQRPTDQDQAARALGLDVAGVLRYQLSVLDREDRLESGTGSRFNEFMADRSERDAAIQASVLRSLQMAVTPPHFAILKALHGPRHLSPRALADETGLSMLTVHENISDLVSAGLATKVPEADQAAITSAGGVIVEIVSQAVRVAGRDLDEAG